MKNSGIKISSVIAGMLVIAAGISLFMFNTGVFDPYYKSIIFSWQMFLIGIGIVFVFSRRADFHGVILILIGAFFMLGKFEGETARMIVESKWIILLIIVGMVLIFKGLFKSRHQGGNGCGHGKSCDGRTRVKGDTSTGYLNRNYIFGGDNEKIDIDGFRGGEINCLFGGGELDFSESTLAESINTLDISVIFGEVVLYVPEEWTVELHKKGIFGGFTDSRSGHSAGRDNTKVLVVEASSIFGGGEIKYR